MQQFAARLRSLMPRWTNWAGDQACEPVAIEAPETLEELQEAVAGAAAAGHRVRVSASGHSFTDCALTEGVMIRLDRLAKPLDFDSATGLFKVEAGAVLRDLNRMLGERGVAFENLGDIDRQTVAGSISTGTHGTGERFQNVSAQIAALELVTADGSLVTVDGSDPDVLRAARVAIGSLGVIYSVTARTVPAFTISRVDSPRPLAETLASLDELNAGTDHFEFYVFPHTDVALCRESRRTGEAPRPRNPALVYAQEVMVENWVGRLFAAGSRRFPSQAPRLARIASGGVGRSTKVDASHKVFASQRRIKFTEMEYAVPRERGREMAERVLELAGRPERGLPGRSRCGSWRRTIHSSAPRTGATPATSPSTRTESSTGARTSAPSRRSRASWVAAPTGASATSAPQPSWSRSIRGGRTSRRSAPGSTRAARSGTTTRIACSVRSAPDPARETRAPHRGTSGPRR